METWTYFRIIALIWGLAAVITKPVLFWIGGGNRWRDWLLRVAYNPDRRPKWVYWAALFAAILVAFTWFQVIATSISHGWILAAVMTLAFGKVVTLLFDYPRFTNFVKETLTHPQKENRMVIVVSVMGVVLILLAFFMY